MNPNERTARNTGVEIGHALKVFCFCLFVGAASVGYLYQKNQLEKLGNEISDKELRLNQLKQENADDQEELAWRQTHRYLDKRVQQLGLGLVEPREEQILRLEETLYTSVPQTSDRRYVRRRSGAEEAP
ncbi:MAG: hypothetical protein ACKVJX_09565 [Verrucomicrobiia bacterium]|jgi:hypothetical protein